MALKIGDRIRYLNDVGGGIVVKILKDKMVAILQDDGFEIPMHSAECVFIESASKEKMKEASVAETTLQKDLDYEPEENLATNPDQLNLCLAFVPTTKESNHFDVYLVNDSDYYLYYSLLKEEKDLHLPLYNGLIECNTKLFLATLLAAHLSEWLQIVIQILPFKKQKFKIKGIIQQRIKVNVTKFFKPSNLQKTAYFQVPVLLEQVVVEDFPDIDVEEITRVLGYKDKKVVRSLSKPNQSFEKIEIDLHINKLLDHCVGMTNHEILEHQLSVFHQTMRSNEHNKGQEIIFIHGIGNGTLKAELRKQLKEVYQLKNIEDASFKEYGFGATKVVIA